MPVTSMADHGNAPVHQKEKPKAKLDWHTTKIILKTRRWTMKSDLETRLQSLEADSGHNCPRCMRLASMTEAEIDEELDRMLK
jgi:hypothetical protein